MASWHVTRIDFPPISKGKVKALLTTLQGLDKDFSNGGNDPDIVTVYQDGIRGMWRSPLISRKTLEAILKAQKITPTAWIWEPRHCDDDDCSCHMQPSYYGCSGATCP